MASRLGSYLKNIDAVPEVIPTSAPQLRGNWRDNRQVKYIDTMREEALLYEAKQKQKVLEQMEAQRKLIAMTASPSGLQADAPAAITVELPDVIEPAQAIINRIQSPASMYGQVVSTAIDSLPTEFSDMSPSFINGLLFDVNATTGKPFLMEGGDPRLTPIGMKVAQSPDPQAAILSITPEHYSMSDLSPGGQEYIKMLRASQSTPVITETPSVIPGARVSSKASGSAGEGMSRNPVAPLPPVAQSISAVSDPWADVPTYVPPVIDDLAKYRLGTPSDSRAKLYPQRADDYIRGLTSFPSALSESTKRYPAGGMNAFELGRENQRIGYSAEPAFPQTISSDEVLQQVADDPVASPGRFSMLRNPYIAIPGAAAGLLVGNALMNRPQVEDEQYYQPAPYGQMPNSFQSY